MNDYIQRKEHIGPRDFFPNSGTAGHFDPLSQTIHLNIITQGVFLDALKRRDFVGLCRPLGVMLHEVTHWADLVGTLWGRAYLHRTYDALRLVPDLNVDGKESEFYKLILVHDENRRLLLSRYFRTEHPRPRPHNLNHRWGIEFSAGREFDTYGRPDASKPVVFARFVDNPSRELIARQPIVAGGLLEVNAVYSEMVTQAETIAPLEDIQRRMETRMLADEWSRIVYDVSYTLYTAPAHLLAHHAGVVDIALAYKLSSAVAHLCLNLDAQHYDRLVPPDTLATWAGLFHAFKTRQDRGFAYKVICSGGPRWEEGMSVSTWLDAALSRVGLPSSAGIYSEARATMAKQGRQDIDSLLGRAESYLLELGMRVFDARIGGETALTPSRLQQTRLGVPPMFDPDGNKIPLTPSEFDESRFSTETLHDAAGSLHTATMNLLSACR